MDARREHAQALLDQFTNDWDGSDSIEELIEHCWAIVIVKERDGDAWVEGIDTPEEIASAEGYAGELDVEWVEGVYDLETGEPVRYSVTRTTTVVLANGSAGVVLS